MVEVVGLLLLASTLAWMLMTSSCKDWRRCRKRLKRKLIRTELKQTRSSKTWLTRRIAWTTPCTGTILPLAFVTTCRSLSRTPHLASHQQPSSLTEASVEISDSRATSHVCHKSADSRGSAPAPYRELSSRLMLAVILMWLKLGGRAEVSQTSQRTSQLLVVLMTWSKISQNLFLIKVSSD